MKSWPSAILQNIKHRLPSIIFKFALLGASGFVLHGLANGPNFCSLAIVTVDNARVSDLQQEKNSTQIWTLDYRRQRLSDGVWVSGKLKLSAQDAPLPSQLRDKSPQQVTGKNLLLRVPVEADEPTAHFAFNRQVRLAGLALSVLLLLRWHIRRYRTLGLDPLDKRQCVKLALLIAVINWIWIFELPKGID